MYFNNEQIIKLLFKIYFKVKPFFALIIFKVYLSVLHLSGL